MKKIFIIHGWTYTIEAWKDFERLIPESGFSPVILRVPGLTEPSDKSWTLETYVSWLEEKLAEEKEKVILVAHSNGGRIASIYTAKHPEKVSSLILVDSAGIYHDGLGISIKRKVFGGLVKVGGKVATGRLLKKFLYFLAGERDYDRAPQNMKETMKNVISVDLRNTFRSISVPTLIIWGAKDRATPLSDGQLINELVKNSSLQVFPDADHSPHKTHAKQMVEVITGFLNSHANF